MNVCTDVLWKNGRMNEEKEKNQRSWEKKKKKKKILAIPDFVKMWLI